MAGILNESSSDMESRCYINIFHIYLCLLSH